MQMNDISEPKSSQRNANNFQKFLDQITSDRQLVLLVEEYPSLIQAFSVRQSVPDSSSQLPSIAKHTFLWGGSLPSHLGSCCSGQAAALQPEKACAQDESTIQFSSALSFDVCLDIVSG